MNALVSVRLKAVFSDGKISLSLRGILQENSLEVNHFLLCLDQRWTVVENASRN
jgi:hypothetical protein